MSFPPPWNEGPAASGPAGGQAPPPYRPGGGADAGRPPPYHPGGQAFAPPHRHPSGGHRPPRPAAAAWGAEPGRHRLAEWWQRAAARVIDTLAVGVPVVAVSFAVALMWAGAQSLMGYGGAVERNTGIVYGIVGFLALVGYETVCVKRWRRTLGKHVMKLRVAPLSGAGRQGPIPVASMAARAALFNLPNLAGGNPGWAILLSALLLVPCALWPLWDRPNRQGLHDKLAGTVVLRTD
ncbi:RDD family protein [Streptomonospora sp. PA3]|uniref:RDD family protein n=1 Tax=Streptomonospora sp. PA3 TaxID=2607326 RepID=UPI0012DF1637|nr:RDD family protein [Streptomonospora sp. PA3]MUL43859.1 RDD family protein [Streptomonospora sp. PA3]